jgi:hypothetical protein
MPLYDTLASLWRTVVPLIVGTVAAWLAHAGIGVDSATATAWLTGAFAGAYYALFRVLEAHVSPRWGWLLGLARPPHYPDVDGAITLHATSVPPGDMAATTLPPADTPGA